MTHWEQTDYNNNNNNDNKMGHAVKKGLATVVTKIVQ